MIELNYSTYGVWT